MSSRRLAFVVPATVAALAAAAPPAPAAAPKATTLERLSGVVQPGIVYLKTTYKGIVGNRVYTITASCTGFFVNPDGDFITAGHCVDRKGGRNDIIEAALRDRLKGADPPPKLLAAAQANVRVRSFETPARTGPDRVVRAAYGVDYGGLPTGRPLPVRVRGFTAFEKGDVALGKIEATNVPTLELAPPDTIEVGTQVVSVGYPGSVDLVTDQTFDPSFKDGAISSKKTIKGGLVSVYEVSAAVSPGMSGGPTVDLQGRVVGVNSFGITGEPQPFNFISPVTEIQALLADKGVKNELGPITTDYRAGLNAYYAGDRKTALAKFDDVLGQVPEHGFAQKYRALALKLPKAKGATATDDGGGFPAWLAVLIALALAAGAVAAIFLRRRGGGDGAPVTARGAALVGTAGKLAGERIPVEREVVLGREGAGLAIDDPEISRRHASLKPVDGGLVLTDLGSANGTAVNSRPIDRPTVVVDGDVISLGGASFAVDMPAARAAGKTRLRSKGDVASVPVLVTDGGQRHRITGELVVGREGADILVDDPEMSRRHARVRPVEGGVEVTDLGSANGTAVNGAHIAGPTRVAIGGVVTFGQTPMTVADDSRAETAARLRSLT